MLLEDAPPAVRKARQDEGFSVPPDSGGDGPWRLASERLADSAGKGSEALNPTHENATLNSLARWLFSLLFGSRHEKESPSSDATPSVGGEESNG
jgi:hypothetical protein